MRIKLDSSDNIKKIIIKIISPTFLFISVVNTILPRDKKDKEIAIVRKK